MNYKVLLLICLAAVGCTKQESAEGKFSEFKISEKTYYDVKRVPDEHRDGTSYQAYLNDLMVVESLLSQQEGGQILTQDLINSAEYLSQKVINRYVERKVLDGLKTVDLERFYQNNLDQFSLTKYVVDEYYISDLATFEDDQKIEVLIEGVIPNRKVLMSNNIKDAVHDELNRISVDEYSKQPLLIGNFNIIYHLIERTSETPEYDDVKFRVSAYFTSILRRKIKEEMNVNILREAN
jgi:hypothetical protein